MKYTKTTRIWEINTSKLVVADTLDEAIKLWKSFYNIEEDPTCISAVGSLIDGRTRDYDAIIKD